MDADTSSQGPTGNEGLTDFAVQFKKTIRPLLDTVDKLRNLKVTSEGIPLPTIVVVGEQSSGKTSVLESLAGISLPRGQGIATRVPLVLRLRNCPATESSIYISYGDNVLQIGEDEIREAVEQATNALAGTGKGVTDKAISLHVRKPDAPDLTMIDLPGITRVPVHGQPKDIYEQIAAMIRHYVKPPETVVLNVISAAVDFSTCESIRISKEVDKLGERTFAVVTKVDEAPEGVYEKVTANDVGIGLGYICVRTLWPNAMQFPPFAQSTYRSCMMRCFTKCISGRLGRRNRVDGDGSHEEARRIEKLWFESHPSLSLLDKRFVGVRALAERLSTIQAKMIRLRLPDIEKEVDQALAERQKELENLEKDLPSDGEPIECFMKTMEHNTITMQNLLVNGNHDGFVDQQHMHYPARLEEILQKFNNALHAQLQLLLDISKTEEILNRIKELRGLSLANVLPPTLLRTLVKEEIEKVSDLCTGVVTDAHSYATRFALDLIEKSTSSFPILQEMYKQTAKEVVAASLVTCMNFVHRILAKEKSTVFTVNKAYKQTITTIQNHLASLRLSGNYYSPLTISGDKDFTVNFAELDGRIGDFESAFDWKMNLLAYLSLVYTRLADGISVEVCYSLEGALLRSLSEGVLEASRGQQISHIMQEHPLNLQNRTNLRNRVDLLKDCTEVLRKVF